MRMKDKVTVIIGAGQSPGEGMGNGRATAIVFAREGAKVLCVDNRIESAQETADIITKDGGTAAGFKADVMKDADMKAAIDEAVKKWGRLDTLHYNVGVSLGGGDKSPLEITEEAFD